MPKTFLVLLILAVILITAYSTLAINSSWPNSSTKSERESAVSKAKQLYREAKASGRNFFNGPCLSDALLPDWVLDIAHNPRLPIDDLPVNQCPSYVQSRSHHFVELDVEGNLIRAQ